MSNSQKLSDRVQELRAVISSNYDLFVYDALPISDPFKLHALNLMCDFRDIVIALELIAEIEIDLERKLAEKTPIPGSPLQTINFLVKAVHHSLNNVSNNFKEFKPLRKCVDKTARDELDRLLLYRHQSLVHKDFAMPPSIGSIYVNGEIKILPDFPPGAVKIIEGLADDNKNLGASGVDVYDKLIWLYEHESQLSRVAKKELMGFMKKYGGIPSSPSELARVSINILREIIQADRKV